MKNKSTDTAFFGHPRGLSTLFFTEMWERFSYYGMRAILLYYMISKVDGLGYDQATAMSIMSIYGSLIYLSGVIGGFVSDRIWGSRKTVFFGGILIMIGHIVLATPYKSGALFISIALIVLGTGLLKPNVSEMVGGLYSSKDPRRDSGFSIFVSGINIGALIAPLLVGWVGQEYNYHVGFSLAAIGMFFGLVQYYFDGRKYLTKDSLYPNDPIQPNELSSIMKKASVGIIALVLILIIMFLFKALNITNVILLITILAVIIPVYYFTMMLTSKKTSKVERSRLTAYIPLFIASILFWSIEEQGSVVLAMFASTRTELSAFGISFPASFFQSMNPMFILIYVPIFAWLWVKLGSKQPSSPAKFSIGLMFAGASFLWMMLPGVLFGTDTKVGPLWLVVSWMMVMLGEVLVSPVGLSITTKLAPKSFQSQMMSVWFLSDAVAQALNSQIVRLYTPGTESMYFAVVGGITVAFGIMLSFFIPKIHKLMEGVN